MFPSTVMTAMPAPRTAVIPNRDACMWRLSVMTPTRVRWIAVIRRQGNVSFFPPVMTAMPAPRTPVTQPPGNARMRRSAAMTVISVPLTVATVSRDVCTLP
jgi:hypothetical protein